MKKWSVYLECKSDGCPLRPLHDSHCKFSTDSRVEALSMLRVRREDYPRSTYFLVRNV